MVIQFGIPETQKMKAAEILYEALGSKLKHILGPKEKGIPFLSEHFCDERVITALDNEAVVGVLGLYYKGKDFIDISFWQLLCQLKWRIVTFLFVGWFFLTTIKQDQILVDALAVDCAVRGKGIGSALMDFVIDFARSHQYDQVTLFVIDTNKRAKIFYEKIGFTEIKVHSLIFPWNKILEFNRVYEMVYTL